MSKTASGNFFEDFHVGQEIVHATPRTVTEGDAALYLALTGSRFALNCCEPFAQALGLPAAPVDDLLAFHIVFGKSVPDVSLNAVANLGYADGRFQGLVRPGDTLEVRSRVIGLKENSSGQSGIVYVRSSGRKTTGEPVVEYCRWVMVRKRDPKSPAPAPVVPELPGHVPADRLTPPPGLVARGIDPRLTGSPFFLEDYARGERIDHMDGMAVMESEHRLATRLYQNTARVHFDDHRERQGRLGRCIVYGGVVISLARALSFNGLGNLLGILAINGGRHVNPCVAGDTVYAWSEVLDTAPLAGRSDVGALRLRLVALKNLPAAGFPLEQGEGRYRPEVLLDFDYWGLMPTRAARAR
ncbi:MAG TPA: MaoC family dehydratase [Geminicoccaceae bacterium]|nr:MaoC family dehydratase [Geminicoccaceae bacterium]